MGCEKTRRRKKPESPEAERKVKINDGSHNGCKGRGGGREVLKKEVGKAITTRRNLVVTRKKPWQGRRTKNTSYKKETKTNTKEQRKEKDSKTNSQKGEKVKGIWWGVKKG